MLAELLSEYFFLLLFIGFVAGFVDSIVGGGGLVSAPALFNLFPGIHVLQVIGSQRTGSIIGTSVAAVNYFRKVKLPTAWILAACGCAITASWLGVSAAQMMDKNQLRFVVLLMIAAFAIYTFFRKDFGATTKLRFPDSHLKTTLACAAVGICCGFYNGFIGPGAGTLLVFGFVAVVGLDFLHSSAISKVANVSGDISSWLVLYNKGFVIWKIAIPLLIGNIIGSYAGSSLAILRGSAFIRYVFLAVISALLIRLAFFG